MRAYHGNQAIKDKYLSRVIQHREADQIVQGFGYWADGKGCAVGCTLHSGEHADYETELGIPQTLARLEDYIFEGLPVEVARLWPERFLSAVKPGADISMVWPKLSLWLLRDSGLVTVVDCNRQAIAMVADLYERWITGDVPSQAEWSAARSAAESAAWSAWSAARSAAESAARSAAESAAWSAWSAARSARSAAESAARSAARSAAWSAWSAESAARSAAWSAWSAAKSAALKAAWEQIADKLIELLKSAE